MTAADFVDTNVFVHARDTSEPGKQPAAAQWVEQLWIDHRGRTGVQVLNEYYVTVTRKLRPGMSHDEAWADVRALLAWDPQPVDRDLVIRAHDIERQHNLSWWDAMIVAAAQQQNCALLLTEDLQDGWNCDGVTVCNPFKSQIKDKEGPYTVTPASASRHPGRGRPRRKQPISTG